MTHPSETGGYAFRSRAASFVRGDAIWDGAVKLVSGEDGLARLNEWCPQHPDATKKIGWGMSYSRAPLEAASFAVLDYALRSETPWLLVPAIMGVAAAEVTDSTDGWIVRKGGVASKEGADLDSKSDVAARGVKALALLYFGDRFDRALVVPRVHYEAQLLQHRIREGREFQASSLGKTKVVADGVAGVALAAERTARAVSKKPKAGNIFKGIKRTAEVAAVALVKADVARRDQKQKKLQLSRKP